MDKKTPCTFPNVGHQYFAVISANLIMLSHGFIVGWITPVIPLFLSDQTPLPSGPATLEEVSWVGSISCLGCIVGTFAFGIITSFMGCKRTMNLLAFPIAVFWLIVIYADDIYDILFARFLGGFAAAGIQTTIIIFVAEISNDEIRGKLGSFIQICRSAGVLFAFVLGTVLSYHQIPYVLLWLPIVYMINFLFLPNTPMHLIKTGKFVEAEQSLMYYKGCKCQTPDEIAAIAWEMDRLRRVVEQKTVSQKLKLRDILDPLVVKSFVLAIILPLLSQATGGFAILVYAVYIFERCGSDLDPYMSSIILAVFMILGTLCTTWSVESIGRKALLIMSLIGSAIGHATISAYLYLYEQNVDLTLFTWVPLASLGFITLVSCMGIIPLYNVCIVEATPSKIRNFSISVSTVSVSVFAFISAKSFPIIVDEIQLYGCLLIYAVSSLLGTIFVIFAVKETKGKCLDNPYEENDIKVKDVKCTA